MSQTSTRRRKAVGPARPTYLKADDTDKVMAIVLALMSEVASLRDRVDTHERLAQSGILPTPDAVDEFRPDPDLLDAREARREAYVKRLLRVVLEDIEPDRGRDPAPPVAQEALMTEVMITCAVTGAGDTADKSPHVPVTPQQIAQSAIEAARAGATTVHLHVRDPATGLNARAPELYREAVARIRDSGVDVILNITAGMGGILHRPYDDPNQDGPRSDLVASEERFCHIVELLPEICTIDCGTMNFGAENVVVNRPRDLAWMARRAQELGVKPELECFDMGQVGHALDLIKAGLIDKPPLFQFVLGAAGGAPATAESMMALRAMLPPGGPLGGVRNITPYLPHGSASGPAWRLGPHRPRRQSLSAQRPIGDQCAIGRKDRADPRFP